MLTAYEICEMKRKLEREKDSTRKYLIPFNEGEEIFCLREDCGSSIEKHIITSFRVRNVQWPSLKQAFTDAGYEVGKVSRWVSNF
jgi:hypothetical protein